MKLALHLSLYNGTQYLPYLFASLAEQTYKDWHLYILEDSADMAERARSAIDIAKCPVPYTFVTTHDNQGFASAHNVLFAQHHADYVQLLNQDAILEPDYLEKMIFFLEGHPAHAAVSGKILRWDFDRRDEVEHGKTNVIDSLGIEVVCTGGVFDIGTGFFEKDVRFSKMPHDVFGVSGCLPMYRRQALIEVATVSELLFEPIFTTYKEDVELAFRLREAGWKATVVPNAVAYHRRTMAIQSVSSENKSVVSFFQKPFQRLRISRKKDSAAYFSYRNHLFLHIMHDRVRDVIRYPLLVPYEVAKGFYWLFRRPSFVIRAWREVWEKRATLKERRKKIVELRNIGHVKPDLENAFSIHDIAIVTVPYEYLAEQYPSSVKKAIAESGLAVATVIVDNGSQTIDISKRVFEELPEAFCFLRGKNYGFGSSCNYGTRIVDAKYYFFLNPDTVLDDSGILKKMWTIMETNTDIGVLAPRLQYPDGSFQETRRRFPKWYMPVVQRTKVRDSAFGKTYLEKFLMRDMPQGLPVSVDWAQGSALMVRADVFRRAGGFDDRYFAYFEDTDLCRTVRLMGYDVVYDPRVSLTHIFQRASAKLDGVVKNVLFNKVSRIHIVSCMQYLMKWIGKREPIHALKREIL